MRILRVLTLLFIMAQSVPVVADFTCEKFEEITFYISPEGNDLNDGKTINNAFATLAKAQNQIRSLKENNEFNQPVTIYLLKGTYELIEPFTLTKEDSGNKELLITYKANPGDEVVITGPGLSQLLVLQGNIKSEEFVQFVKISDITFSGADLGVLDEIASTTETVIDFDGTKFCSFENNTIKNVGSQALRIVGEGNKVERNEIFNVGDEGIIHIGTGTEPNSISFNEIHHVMRKLTEGGAIHVSGARSDIKNNLMYDVITKSRSGSAYAIYLDEGTSQIGIENNIIERTTSGIFCGTSNKDITITNNLFIDIQDHIIGSENTNGQEKEGIQFVKNIIYGVNSDACIYMIDKAISLPSESDFNVFWNPFECFTQMSFLRLCDTVDLEYFEGIERFFEWQKLGYDKNTILWDPGLVDVSGRDYRLKPKSVALIVGIKSIDVSKIGLQEQAEK